jgi:uncharacterized protein (TIRG00374 family)
MEIENKMPLSGEQGRVSLKNLKLKQQWWMWVIWLTVPVLFWWVLSQVSFAEVWQPLSKLSLFEIGLLLFVKGLLELLLSGRWWLLLSGLGHRVRLLTLLGYELAGFGVSYFTPGPQVGGEALQVYLVQRKHGVSLTNSVASLTLDRLLGALAQSMLLVGAFGAVLVADYSEQVASFQIRTNSAPALAVVLAITSLPLAYISLLWRGKRPLSYLLGLLPSRAIWHYIWQVEEQVGTFIQEKTALFCQALFLSLVVWPTLLAIDLGLALHLFGMPVSIVETLIILIAIRVVTLMPVPAGLGTLEACIMVAMQIVGGEPAIGLALSLFVRARDVLYGAFGLLWGAIVLRE